MKGYFAHSTICMGSTTSHSGISTSMEIAMDIHGRYTEVLIRWMERLEAGQPPIIFGDGQQTMDFVHVRDVARANILGAKADVSDEVFNVASGSGNQPRATGAVARYGDGPEWVGSRVCSREVRKSCATPTGVDSESRAFAWLSSRNTTSKGLARLGGLVASRAAFVRCSE